MNASSTTSLQPSPFVALKKHWDLRGSALCITHHMTSAEVDGFAHLCASLLQANGPLALLVLVPATGEFLEHCQLHCNPHFKAMWDTMYANELGCLCQGIGSGDAPSAKRVVGTNTFFLIDYQDIPAHKRKEICHTMMICEEKG
jgi:hypothetical protein